MATAPDVTVHLPAEQFEALSEVLRTGIQRAKIDPQIRKELRDWWEAESEFIKDEIREQQ